jgi:DNA-directed RNA polymerase specialized sigma24 family protein
MTEEGLHRLLAALDADRERAGERYVLLRHKLVKFFEWRRALAPEDCADRTLNVAAARLVEGEPVRNLPAYCVGIARMVLLEEHRRSEREHAALNELRLHPRDHTSTAGDVQLQVLEQCLAALPSESRELILAYYGGDGQVRVGARRSLARRLGIPINALRIRAHRIRLRLEASVRAVAEAGTDLEK